MVELAVLVQLCSHSVDRGKGEPGGGSLSQRCMRGWRGVERDGRRGLVGGAGGRSSLALICELRSAPRGVEVR